jgi:ABC-type sugar transport system ATPase subunit
MSPENAGAPPLLVMEGIDKSFPGVRALKGARLELRSGEVLGLVGENGAGKSTLIKVLAGAHAPDAGRIFLDRRETRMGSPLDAQRAGIAVIYQEFNLVPTLTARENIFLGQERTRAGFLSRRREAREAVALFRRMNVRIDPETLCRDLTVAEQQVVEIAKALATKARIIVMDEPSATLTTQEVERLFAIIRELKGRGIGTVYISHRLEEVFQIADRVTVMRDGEHIATRPVGELTRASLIEMMVGRSLESEFPAKRSAPGEPLLEVAGLTRRGAVSDVSFTLSRGEILAITGLVGAGRTEVARLLFGADRPDAGTIACRGRPLRLRSPRDAIRNGICLLTEDRKGQGLVLGLSVRENFGLPNLPRWSVAQFVRLRREREACARYVNDLKIKVPHQEQRAKNLSGGNQQKLVLAKWLASESEVVIFDEPTRGIDVGAKYEIYLLMQDLVARGKGILMISSELPEVLGMSDRILVMHEGRITGEIADVAAATPEDVMELAVG